MTRSEVTEALSRRVEAYMARRYHLWASEVYLSAYTQDGGAIDIRPDYLAFNLSHGNYASKAAWVERGMFTVFEVKSCADDLTSGHGLNFIGDKNYIVTTRELGEQLRGNGPLSKHLHNADGVLVPSGNGLRMLFENSYSLGYRKFAASELLWAIIRTRRARLSGWDEATTDAMTCINVHEPPKDTTFWPAPHFKCSKCGATHVSMEYVFYCPNCGAKVVDAEVDG